MLRSAITIPATTLITALLCAATLSSTAQAQDVTIAVTVQIIDAAPTKRAPTCAVWSRPNDFLTSATKADHVTSATQGVDGKWRCHLTLPKAGSYSIAIMDDKNNNKRLDTNLFGIPTEGWGTSRDVKPALRAPRFEESRVALKDGSTLNIKMHR